MLALWNVDSLRRFYYGVKYQEIILKYSSANGLDPYLVAALIYAESGFDSKAVSDVGARGLMQLMPETAREMAVQQGQEQLDLNLLFEADTNIRLGTGYLAIMLFRFQNTEDALAAYNAGPTLVREWKTAGKAIPYPETRKYVKKVLKTRSVLHELYPDWASISDRDS